MTSVKMDSLNPCCVQWKTRYSKMEEKRNALRQGVEILKAQIDRLQQENADLQRVHDEDRARLQNVKVEKEEASLGNFMKKEAITENLDMEKEVTQLRTCVSERDVEIDRLRKVLDEEIMKRDAEKKTTELERRKAFELHKSLECERNIAEDYRLQFETLKNEFERTNQKLEEEKKKQYSVEMRVKEEECRANTLLKQLEEEKQNVERLEKEMQENVLSKRSIDSSELDEVMRKLEAEKKLVEEEKEGIIEQRRIIEENEKIVSQERCHADTLVKQLEEEKEKVERLQKEIQEIALSKINMDLSELDEVKKKVARERRFVKEEKEKVIEQRKIAETNEKRFFEEKCRADKLLLQLEEEKLKVEKLQNKMVDLTSNKHADISELKELKRILEIEKEKVALSRRSFEEEKAKTMEQRRIAESNEKKFLEEKCRADNLSLQLEKEREKVGKLQREMSFQKTTSLSRLDEVCRNLEVEKKNVARERNRADTEKSNSKEQEKIAKANEMRAIEEKKRCENLLNELENEKQKLQNMEQELKEVKSRMGLVGTSRSPTSVSNEQVAKVGILQEQLKLEKKRVKHAKQVANLEKDRNNMLRQELYKVKNDFQCLLDHLSILSNIFGAKNGLVYLPQKLDRPQMHFRGDEELRMSGLTSRDASCPQKSNTQLVQAGQYLESTSGMENELNPLKGDFHGQTLPSSALNSNTSSFSDEQLVGSQERLDGPNHQTNPRSSVETCTYHVKKKRKNLDEFESIKSMHFEGRKVVQEADEKLQTLHNLLLQSELTKEIEKENLPCTVAKSNERGNFDNSSKKMMPFHEQVGRESSKPQQIIVRDEMKKNRYSMEAFEQIVNEDYMKLLDLDDVESEECYRMIMEKPLSPILSEFDLAEFGEEVGVHTHSVSVSGNNIEVVCNEFSARSNTSVKFVMYSEMEDSCSRTRVFCATRVCVSRCFSSLQTVWSVNSIIDALLSEKDLRPREKACVFFTLMLLNFSYVSSGKSTTLSFQEQMDSFSTHIRSVLHRFETRERLAKICYLDDILTLSKDFILNKKILSNIAPNELLNDCGSIVEIFHEGEKILLYSKLASSNLILSGSIIYASISNAICHIDSVCEFSMEVLQMGRSDYSLALSILHTFAYICGDDYFTINNYSVIMKVVKSVVTFIEVSLTKNDKDNLQPGEITQHWFSPCVRCPFLEGSVSLNDVSLELLAELQQHIVPQNVDLSASLSNSDSLSCFLGDVMLSLELIVSIKGWDWVCDMIVPKLLKMLESNNQDSAFSTALVALLASIGRLGVKARGYDDTGVESIKRHLLGLLSQTTSSKSNVTLSMTIIYGLIELYPKGHEIFHKFFNAKLPFKEGLSSSSFDIVSRFLSSLSSEEFASLASLVNSNGDIDS